MEEIVCRVSEPMIWRRGRGDRGIQGNVVRSATTTDCHRGNIPTRSQLRPLADYKENHDPRGSSQILLRKQTRVSVILSTANQRPICISRAARYFIDPFPA